MEKQFVCSEVASLHFMVSLPNYRNDENRKDYVSNNQMNISKYFEAIKED